MTFLFHEFIIYEVFAYYVFQIDHFSNTMIDIAEIY